MAIKLSSAFKRLSLVVMFTFFVLSLKSEGFDSQVFNKLLESETCNLRFSSVTKRMENEIKDIGKNYSKNKDVKADIEEYVNTARNKLNCFERYNLSLFYSLSLYKDQNYDAAEKLIKKLQRYKQVSENNSEILSSRLRNISKKKDQRLEELEKIAVQRDQEAKRNTELEDQRQRDQENSEDVDMVPACPGSYSSFTWHMCIGNHSFRGEGEYFGEFENGRAHGQGTRTYADGDKYVGEWKDNKYHGQGTFTRTDGSQYVGEWKDDKRQGQGNRTWSDGSQYVGEWKDDKRHGQGNHTWSDGSQYIGEWKEHKRNGQGTRTYADGRKYVGEWKDNKYHGQGTFTRTDGSKYVGEWKDDKRQGQGNRTWSDGSQYIGEFKNGKSHGIGHFYRKDGSTMGGLWKNDVFLEGYSGYSCLEEIKDPVDSDESSFGSKIYNKLFAEPTKPTDKLTYIDKGRIFSWSDCIGAHTYADGSLYIGEYKDGRRKGLGVWTSKYKYGKQWFVGQYEEDHYWKEGQGAKIWSDGQKYVGEWKDNKYHGQGTFTRTDGSKYVGEFKDNNYHGQGTYTFADGDKYVGEWKDDKRHGQGAYTSADGGKYVGEFKDGQMQGQGTYFIGNGEKYVGEFKDDKRHGQGTYTWPDASKWTGCWKDGKQNGKNKICSSNSSSKQNQKTENPWSELEKAFPLKQAGMYMVYAEKCADNYWMEKADSETFVNALDEMIKRGISEGRVSKETVNQSVDGGETIIAMNGFTYEQQQLCQTFTLISRQLGKREDRY